MLKSWLRFILELLHRTPDEVSHSHRLRVHRGVSWRVSGSEFFDGSLTWDRLMFLGASNKPKGLERHYLNVASIDEARKELDHRISRRRQGVAAFDFKGKPKIWGFTEHTSQCMLAGSIAYDHTRRECFVRVFYRSSDVIKAFPADLLFLRDSVLGRFDFNQAPVAEVDILFSSIYFDPRLAILIAGYVPRWREHFLRVRYDNPTLFNHIIYWAWGLLCDPEKNAHEFELTERYYRYLCKLTTEEQRDRITRWVDRQVRRDADQFPESIRRHYVR